MNFLDTLYLLLLFVCAVFSFYNETARKEKLWLYFLPVFLSELYVIAIRQNCDERIYLFSGLIYNIYLIFYFQPAKKIKLVLIAVYFICILWAFNKSFYHDKVDTLSNVILYLFLSLNYYYSQIKNPNEIPLYKKQRFWIATGIFIWSIAYYFSAFPKSYLSNQDIFFLQTIVNTFQYINFLCYCIFLIGLNCKSS
ncbi:MAG: hypothetical protein JST62_03010 [Bacteroidetes bacterium]|nr:hypothetical protein [Bacteroidota bacterium]